MSFNNFLAGPLSAVIDDPQKAPTSEQIELQVLYRLYFEPAAGTTFGHLMAACGLHAGRVTNGESEYRMLDKALRRLRRRGAIRVARGRQWVIAK